MERFVFLVKIFFLSMCLCFFSAAVFCAALEHVVQKGETLYAISRTYAVSLDDLCKENSIQKTDTLKAGQKLTIPPGSGAASKPAAKTAEAKIESYKVAQDDTLYGIARMFNMGVDDLKNLNNLSADTIKVGQTLKVHAAPELPITLGEGGLSDPRSYAGKNGDTSLIWPVKASSVTYVTGKMSGVQLGAQRDEDVSSISSGTVMFSGVYRGFGQVVFVQSGTGYVYVYTGLASVAVSKGDYVTQGRMLGKTGVDALNGKSQLTFMVYRNGKALDPAAAPRG
jgi:LysM repeat protein